MIHPKEYERRPITCTCGLDERLCESCVDYGFEIPNL